LGNLRLRFLSVKPRFAGDAELNSVAHASLAEKFEPVHFGLENKCDKFVPQRHAKIARSFNCGNRQYKFESRRDG
jgi:hypothetical protein